mgnify:CR=1 FL=1
MAPNHSVEHTSFEEQQAFLRMSPSEQNLKIYMNGRETNGSVAEALRRIAKLEGLGVVHEGRMTALEHWQIKAAAIIAAAIIGGPLVFFLLGQILGGE